MQVKYIRDALEKSIAWIVQNVENYMYRPRDVTRNRKLSIGMMLLYLLTAGASSAVTELTKLFRSITRICAVNAACEDLA